MAIKKQNKRALEVSAPAQNGAQNKKQKTSQKAKLEKAPQVQNNGLAGKKAQKAEKPKPKVPAGEQQEKKKEQVGALSPEAIAERIAAKKMKVKAKHEKKNQNRKEARKEQGQYKAEKIQMSAEQLQIRIDAITSRPELTKTAKRKLATLKKRMSVVQGTYVAKPKPKSDGPQLTKSQRRHKRKMESKARATAKSGNKLTVSEEESTGVVAKPGSTKQKAIVAALQPAAKREKLAKGGKQQQQQQAKGKEAKKAVAKKAEPEDDEDDDDEDAEEEEDSNEEVEEEEEDSDEEVDTSTASFMNTTGEDDDDDEDDEEEEDDDEEEDDSEEDGEEEVAVPVAKKAKQEPAKKGKQETEKKPFVKKENAKAEPKNGPAADANGDSNDGKKKRFVLFVGNLSYESTQDDIKNHFLTKVGEVSSVRIPSKPGTNSPRGFAYVEVTNDTDYEKGLSLHNTTLNGRRLNVEYTRGGSKSVGNRTDIVSKNKKLHAMRKQGMLAGSRKEGHNRNDRRQKARQQGPA